MTLVSVILHTQHSTDAGTCLLVLVSVGCVPLLRAHPDCCTADDGADICEHTLL